MSKFDPQAFTALASVRLYTEDEIASAVEWAADVADSDTSATEKHPLIAFITSWTATTRPTEFYSANFKKLYPAIMPYVIKVCERHTGPRPGDSVIEGEEA